MWIFGYLLIGFIVAILMSAFDDWQYDGFNFCIIATFWPVVVTTLLLMIVLLFVLGAAKRLIWGFTGEQWSPEPFEAPQVDGHLFPVGHTVTSENICDPRRFDLDR